MRLLVSGLLAAAAAAAETFHVAGGGPGPWPAILSSAGLVPSPGSDAKIVVLPSGVPAAASAWRPRISRGAIVVVEGDSELARVFGIEATERRVIVRQLRDTHDETVPIIWERATEVPVYGAPKEASVYTRERWTSAPMTIGVREGKGALLWLPLTPGEKGHERFPYLLQALRDLGLDPPFRSGRLWAFFDSSYRLRADPEYLAARWRAAGIGALQVAAWHFHEAGAQSDEYLRQLIEACHRNAILVYAWIELPHVSEKFWDNHPEWREKTALLQDAHLDWRKLMNLANPDCARAVKSGIGALADRFDWDGLNLAELYFESLEGIENAARFTPFNDDVRAEFRGLHGVDPVAVVRDPNSTLRPKLLEYRARLAQRIQEEWLAELSQIRKRRPHLDLVLTHVDDKFDTRMRDLIGAESDRLLPQLDKYDFTFLIEDPATIWHLGPQRYPQIAERYNAVTAHKDKLAIDINIVDRYQDVYPTKQQTGVELFQLVNLSARAFARVALYFESSIRKVDLPWLASSAANVRKLERSAGQLILESGQGAGVAWTGPAKVNGRLWPIASDSTLWLPAGRVTVESSTEAPPLRIVDFNGDIQTASAGAGEIELSYQSSHRAIAVLDRAAAHLEIDGAAAPMPPGGTLLLLPRGQHVITLR